MINPVEAGAWVTAARGALDLLKSAWQLLPKGKDKDSLARKIEEAEQAISLANAHAAKELGYKLCQCTFPPKPMLWNEDRKLFVCQNPSCGRTLPLGMTISDEALALASKKPFKR